MIAIPAEAQGTASPLPTRVEADTEKEEIRFYVADQLVAIVDHEGFRIRGEISYAGALTNLNDPDNVIPAAAKEQEANDGAK